MGFSESPALVHRAPTKQAARSAAIQAVVALAIGSSFLEIFAMTCREKKTLIRSLQRNQPLPRHEGHRHLVHLVQWSARATRFPYSFEGFGFVEEPAVVEAALARAASGALPEPPEPDESLRIVSAGVRTIY